MYEYENMKHAAWRDEEVFLRGHSDAGKEDNHPQSVMESI